MIYPVIDQSSEALAVDCLCRLTRIPRSSYYRHRKHTTVSDSVDPVCPEVHRICEEYPRYGYRRVTHELRRRGYRANHKRILALMRQQKLLCRLRKRFVRTTDSRHGLPVYANLVPSMTLTGPNQLWVADLTYIRLAQGFAYLAVLLDAWSRRAIGWAISSHIDTQLSLQALRMALATRHVGPGLVHHSDQGVQYASADYVDLLRSRDITISMSRTANPYDNALAESFIKTLKTEEVYLNEYRDLLDAKNNIEQFIDRVYNQKRLHSSIGYQTPVEYEAQIETLNPSTLTVAKTVSV